MPKQPIADPSTPDEFGRIRVRDIDTGHERSVACRRARSRLLRRPRRARLASPHRRATAAGPQVPVGRIRTRPAGRQQEGERRCLSRSGLHRPRSTPGRTGSTCPRSLRRRWLPPSRRQPPLPRSTSRTSCSTTPPRTPSRTPNLVEQNRRLGDAALYQFVGTTTFTGGSVTMQFNSQGAALADSVKAWEKFAAGGVVGFMVRRLNVPKATNVTAGQFVHVFPCEFGPFMPTTSGKR